MIAGAIETRVLIGLNARSAAQSLVANQEAKAAQDLGPIHVNACRVLLNEGVDLCRLQINLAKAWGVDLREDNPLLYGNPPDDWA